MKKVDIRMYCDICGEESLNTKKINYPVVFYTDQTEGRSCNPYISQETLDICESCRDKVLRLKGYGAQGLNNYSIID